MIHIPKQGYDIIRHFTSLLRLSFIYVSSCSSSIIKALTFHLVFGLMAIPGFGEFLVLSAVDLSLFVVGDIMLDYVI